MAEVGWVLVIVGAIFLAFTLRAVRRATGMWWPRCSRCRRWIFDWPRRGVYVVQARDPESWHEEGVFCADCFEAKRAEWDADPGMSVEEGSW